jgi:hypothetical protein
MSLDRLAECCRAVLAEEDRVGIFLLAHFATQRVGEVPDPTTDEAGSTELREIVGQLQHKLDPERFSRLNRARAEAAKAEERAMEVALRRGGHRDLVSSWEARERERWVR